VLTITGLRFVPYGLRISGACPKNTLGLKQFKVR
jgi:hypothetical protein